MNKVNEFYDKLWPVLIGLSLLSSGAVLLDKLAVDAFTKLILGWASVFIGIFVLVIRAK